MSRALLCVLIVPGLLGLQNLCAAENPRADELFVETLGPSPDLHEELFQPGKYRMGDLINRRLGVAEKVVEVRRRGDRVGLQAVLQIESGLPFRVSHPQSTGCGLPHRRYAPRQAPFEARPYRSVWRKHFGLLGERQSTVKRQDQAEKRKSEIGETTAETRGEGHGREPPLDERDT